jgi:hypothetical protein
MGRWFVVVAVSFGFLIPSAMAAPLAPSKPSQLADVTIGSLANCTAISPRSRVLDQINRADGTTGPFQIPDKQVFVVTGVEFSAQLLLAGHRYEFALFREPVAGGGFSLITYVDGVSDGAPRVTLNIPHGSVVKAGTRLCAAILDFNEPATNIIPSIVVHGFFAKDK